MPSAWHETCFNSAHALRCAEHVHVTSTSHARHLARILLRAACSVPRSGTQLGTRPASCSMFRATRLARGLLRSASPVFGSGVAVERGPVQVGVFMPPHSIGTPSLWLVLQRFGRCYKGSLHLPLPDSDADAVLTLEGCC